MYHRIFRKGGIFVLSRREFIRISLEVNLFFQRIMKEHMFFMEVSFFPVNSDYMEEANILKKSFEELLSETVELANGAISNEVLKSHEIVTPFTLNSEEVTSSLTGASLDFDITKAELNLVSDPNFNYTKELELMVFNLNKRSLNILIEVIEFKEKVLSYVLECKIATGLYPLLIEHILNEAKYYMEDLQSLQNMKLPDRSFCEEVTFWDNKMAEHAEFIDGLLDPTEKKLKEMAEDFAEEFENLIEECDRCRKKDVLNRNLKATEAIKEFKQAATVGLLDCKIKSITNPLLADHVMREANYFLRILNSIKI